MSISSVPALATLRTAILSDAPMMATLAGLTDRDAMVTAIADFAAARSLTVSRDEVAAALAAEAPVTDGELTDDDLELVAAGSTSKVSAPSDIASGGASFTRKLA